MRVIIDQTLVIWLLTISFDHNVLQKSTVARPELWAKQPGSWLPHLVDGLLKDTVAPHQYIVV